MTREEAIERLENMDNVYNQLSDEDKEALEMAIEALKAEPCEDCVSRETALKAFEELPHEYKTKEQRARTGGIAACQVIVRELPPVTPKQRTGHWFVDERPESDREIICSNCEQSVFKYHKMDFDYRPAYCPNCGAKMGGESE